jgi:hypothetical protein
MNLVSSEKKNSLKDFEYVELFWNLFKLFNLPKRLVS